MRIYLLQRKGSLSDKKAKQGKSRKNSLYLVYHYGTGQKRDHEFLNLYVYDKAKNHLEKEHNKETMKLAEAIRAKKILDSQSSQHGFVSTVRLKISFLNFFKSIVDKKYDSCGNHGNWLSTYQHLKDFLKGKDMTMEQLDERFLESFKEYLQTCNTRHSLYQKRLSQNSILSYYSKVRAALREAYNSKLIRENPSDRVKGVKPGESNRQYLSFEELQRLAKVPCEISDLKRRFLFSCLTGLRWSDIDKLKWSELVYTEKTGWAIHFTQKKTKQTEFLPISEQAVNLLGEVKSSDGLVFGKVKYSNWTNLKLREWMLAADIKKKITFHCGRHTFATLQLAHDTDIYTVSKLLGHKHLKTTEVYTKVIDKRKIDAASRIPSIF